MTYINQRKCDINIITLIILLLIFDRYMSVKKLHRVVKFVVFKFLIPYNNYKDYIGRKKCSILQNISFTLKRINVKNCTEGIITIS